MRSPGYRSSLPGWLLCPKWDLETQTPSSRNLHQTTWRDQAPVTPHMFFLMIHLGFWGTYRIFLLVLAF